MVDKIATVARAKLGRRIGQLKEVRVALEWAVTVFLRLAGAGWER